MLTYYKIFRNISFAMLCIGVLGITQSYAQDLQFSLPHQTVNSGDAVQVDISTSNFKDMVSVQFSLNWNPNIIQFESSNNIDLDNIAVGTSDVENGNLRISWFDVDGIGQSLVDDSKIVRLQFVATGNVGDSTAISIVNEPIEIQLFQDIGLDSVFHPVEYEIFNGSVVIGNANTAPQVSIAANITNVNCNGIDNGGIDIALVGNGNYTFSWTGPNGFVASEPDIENLASGEYMLNVMDADGLTVLDTSFIVTQPFAALMVEEIQTDTTDCDKTNGTAIVNVSGGTTPYLYDIGFGGMSQNMMAGLAAGMYDITITDANDCTQEMVFEIASPSDFSVDLGEDINLCEGEEVFIESVEGAVFEWSTGANTASISVSEAGLYSVTVTDEFECTAMDTIAVQVLDGIRLELENDTLSLCKGDSIQLIALGAESYTWQGETNSLSATDIANPMANPEQTTTYLLEGEGACGMDTLSVEVQVFETEATAGRDTCIGAGEQVQLQASGGAYYYWLGGDYPLSDYNVANPFTTPEDSTTYRIMIVDENGCTTLDAVTVLVASNPTRFINQINLLTPNGDGKNDELYFGNIEKYGPNTLKVFNRWGGVVYDRVNYQHTEHRFDGTRDGKDLPAGTYYYILSFREESIKQTLTITRD